MGILNSRITWESDGNATYGNTRDILLIASHALTPMAITCPFAMPIKFQLYSCTNDGNRHTAHEMQILCTANGCAYMAALLSGNQITIMVRGFGWEYQRQGI